MGVLRDPRVYEAVVGEELKRLDERELYRPLAFTGESLDVMDGRSWLRGQASSILVEKLRRVAARRDPPRPTSPPEAVIYASKVSWWLEEQLLELGRGPPTKTIPGPTFATPSRTPCAKHSPAPARRASPHGTDCSTSSADSTTHTPPRQPRTTRNNAGPRTRSSDREHAGTLHSPSGVPPT